MEGGRPFRIPDQITGTYAKVLMEILGNLTGFAQVDRNLHYVDTKGATGAGLSS